MKKSNSNAKKDKNKIRFMLSNEFSGLETGFSKIGRELMTYLNSTGKYILSEVASYCNVGDKRIKDYPWTVYPVIPPKNSRAYRMYETQYDIAQYGALRFNSAIIEEQPDIVFDMRDFWMMKHILQSPYRDNFKLITRPPVDSIPQRSDWIRGFKQSDVVFSHSRWGKEILQNYGLEIKDVMQGGVNDKYYKPLDKKEIREKYCLNPDLNIILTVSRNQARKLLPDLFESYSIFKDKYPELSKKTALLLHTSYPDSAGWDLLESLNDFGIRSDVIFSNICKSCGKTSITYLQPEWERTGYNLCVHCNQSKCVFPNTNFGVSEEVLNEIYNLGNLYVQYSGGEGWGCPMIEAKATELPVLTTPYSAMKDHVEDPGGIEQKITGYYYYWAAMQKRVIPDKVDFADKINWFFEELTKEERENIGKEGRKFVLENYKYNTINKRIHQSIMSTPLFNRADTWDSPKKIISSSDISEEDIKPELNNYEFIKYMYTAILQRVPKNDFKIKEMLAALNFNVSDRKTTILHLKELANGINKFEEMRVTESIKKRNLEKESSIKETEFNSQEIIEIN